jgi:hypothetical protein
MQNLLEDNFYFANNECDDIKITVVELADLKS